ncbi:hypothetical protein JOC86_003460 [Bacillus pakistanensis]|uniref:Uncharacterized protein n=1 Tax=Rossellomorea pakistanensis TaxID=992288 RepID=A0ABS2NGG9_9BACI|nr:hypothetical protein [Bacillus pakistanensis]
MNFLRFKINMYILQFFRNEMIESLALYIETFGNNVPADMQRDMTQVHSKRR